MSYIAELKSKNILIIGAGTTGKSVARYLENIGARFQIIDEKAATLDGAEILNNVPEDESFDLAIVSPGWRKDHSIIENLSAKGIEVISEIDFAWNLKMELNPEQKWVALTGTNGKTTTVQMLESILISAGANAIAGCSSAKKSPASTGPDTISPTPWRTSSMRAANSATAAPSPMSALSRPISPPDRDS